MSAVYPQYVVDENQVRRAVLLSLEDWDRIVEDLEDLEDMRACDALKARNEEFIPFDQALREIDEGCIE